MLFYILALFIWSVFFAEVFGQEICFKDLECFPTGKPWSSLTRPVPQPQGPNIIKVNYQLFTRSNQEIPYHIKGDSKWTLSESFYDNRKPTYIVAHGWKGTPEDQLPGVSDALLTSVDANVIQVDYGSMKDNPYSLAVSNARVAGALIAKFLRYLIHDEGTPISNFHLMGISLGAHVIAYAAKRVPGIPRLTGLEPAQPLFEGMSPEVRFDKDDALLVDVVHTNGRPILPFGGLGINTPIGDIDFYFNGGWNQPGCRAIDVTDEMFKSGNFNLLEVWPRSLLCPHARSMTYFLEAYGNPNCTFWGVRRQENSIFWGLLTPRWRSRFFTTLSRCTIDMCSPFGLRTAEFPARGSFDILTSDSGPYCMNMEDVDASMERQVRQYRSTQRN